VVAWRGDRDGTHAKFVQVTLNGGPAMTATMTLAEVTRPRCSGLWHASLCHDDGRLRPATQATHQTRHERASSWPGDHA